MRGVSLQSMKLSEKKVPKQAPRKQILYLRKLYMKLHLGVTLLRKRTDLSGLNKRTLFCIVQDQPPFFRVCFRVFLFLFFFFLSIINIFYVFL